MLIGRNVRMYGPVSIGDDVIIEDDVIIGHPSAEEVNNSAALRSSFNHLDDYYSSISKSPTIVSKGSVIRSGTIIYNDVQIGHRFECGHFVLIRESCRFGDNVYIKGLSHIMKGVILGNDCRVSGIIADNSIIGNSCSIFGTLTHRQPKRHSGDQGPWIGPTVGDHTLIGRGAVVLGPVEIGTNSTVGSNVVIRQNLPDGSRVVK